MAMAARQMTALEVKTKGQVRQFVVIGFQRRPNGYLEVWVVLPIQWAGTM